MIWVSFICGFLCGLVPGIAYARRQIVQIQRDDLSFRMAPTIPHSIEDAARRVGA